MTRPPAVYWDEPQAACLKLMPRPRLSASRRCRPPWHRLPSSCTTPVSQSVTEHRVNTLFDLTTVALHCSRHRNQRWCCGGGWVWWVPDYDGKGCLLPTGRFKFRLSIINRLIHNRLSIMEKFESSILTMPSLYLCYRTIQYNTMRVFSAPYTRNRTGRHYNSHRMCVE